MQPTEECVVVFPEEAPPRCYRGSEHAVAITDPDLLPGSIVVHTHPAHPDWPPILGPSPQDVAELWYRGVRQLVLLEPAATWAIHFPRILTTEDKDLPIWSLLLQWADYDTAMQRRGQFHRLHEVAREALEALKLPYRILEAT